VSTYKKPTANWTAYDYLLQGRELCNAHREAEAAPLFSRATAIDPNFVEANAWLAIGLMGTYWENPDPNTLDRAAHAAQRALELDSNDSMVHHANAIVMLWLRRYEGSATHFDRAIALNPVDPETRADRAILLNFTGRSEEALSVIDDALRRSPFPPAWFWQIRGLILLHLKRYAEVVDALNSVPHKNIFSISCWLQRSPILVMARKRLRRWRVPGSSDLNFHRATWPPCFLTKRMPGSIIFSTASAKLGCPNDYHCRLAAIIVANVVGYTHQMDTDEAGTLVTREKLWSEVVQLSRTPA
jgi:tetratricopeptide (TPR) repeat protein